MLSEDPQALHDEVENARVARADRLGPTEELVAWYCGEGYRVGFRPTEQQFEAHVYQMLADLVPDLVFGDPAFALASPMSLVFGEQMAEETAALNTIAKAGGLGQTLERIAVDTCLCEGFARVDAQPLPGMESDPEPWLRPAVRRVSPWRMLYDPMAATPEQSRFWGEEVEVDLEDLQNAADPETGEPIFNQRLLSTIARNTEPEGEPRRVSAKRAGIPDRRTVLVVEFYLPERRTLYTMCAYRADGGYRGEFLREPRPFLGRPRGPWVHFGLGYVPDEAQPLSPVAAVRSEIDRANRFASAIDRGAEEAKRLMLYDAGDKVLGNAVTSAESGSAIPVPNFDPRRAGMYDFGGVHPDLVVHHQRLLERLNRTIGSSEAGRGNPDPDVKATADAIAERANQRRSRSLQGRFRRGVAEIGEAILYLLRSSQAFKFNVDGTDQASGQPWSGTFVGGQHPARLGPDEGDMQVSVEPYSMEFIDEATIQRRALQFNEQLLGIGNALLQQPHINWRRRLRDTGESMNIPDADRRYLNLPAGPAGGDAMAAGGLTGTAPPGTMPAPAGEEPQADPVDRLMQMVGQ